MAAQPFCAVQWTLEAFQTMVMIFADYEPNWHRNIEKPFDDFLSMKHGFESCSSTDLCVRRSERSFEGF